MTGPQLEDQITVMLGGRAAEELIYSGIISTGAADDGVGGSHLHEPGSRETALVQQGRVVLVCDGLRYELQEGDTVTFDADLPHHFENPTTDDAAFLAVVSAGLRRS